MIDLASVGLVLAGVVLLFAGAALSVYGVVLLGTILGGSGGYLVGPTVVASAGADGAAAVAGPIVLGAVAGGLAGYLLLSVAVAAMSFVVGTALGASVLAPLFVDGQWYVEWAGALAIGGAAAVLGMFLTKWMLGALTAFVGAALASRSLTVADFVAAREALHPEPLLFDVTAPLFLALVALGVLSQVGLFKFGYVTWIARRLPGAGSLSRRRGDESEPA